VLPIVRVRFLPTDLEPEVKNRSIAVGGEQDGPQPTRRRRRQHMHHAGRCPVPTDSRLFPLDQTKRERHNSLNLNGSEGCVARCPTVPAVFRVAPMARGLRATDAAQAEPGRWCPPGGQFMPVFARYCPVTGEISSGFSQRARGSSPLPRTPKTSSSGFGRRRTGSRKRCPE
jgi:hypothetical protein